MSKDAQPVERDVVVMLPRAERGEVVIGEMTVRRMRVGKVWLTNGIGEGMETGVEKLEQVLKEFFNREF